MENKILTAYSKKAFSLKNHLVMAPMTRSRAIDNIPNDLMAEYYGQRTGAGLIITEGTAPAPEALGYPRIPGVFSQPQIDGWRKVTDAVHAGNSKIFLQLMHTGRIGHNDNLPKGVNLVGASNIKAEGQIFTDTKGLQDHSQPTALTTQGVKEVINSYINAAKNVITAGFDGVELHGANGYLLEQFLNPNVNTRTDEYGGNMQSRAKIILEVAEKVADSIGSDKVGIRFSPYSSLGDLQPYAPAEVHETYLYLAKELDKLNIAYIHISVNPQAAKQTLDEMHVSFTGTFILCNAFTPETAVTALSNGSADLVAFGRSFLANPDLAKRIAGNEPLNQPDFTTLYTPGAKGYTDYPVLDLTPVS